ncbi:MAG: hypothetical protein Q7R87_02940 [Nanoarchaeota archaeon]|nr:hypothetical protein [Nanoarchaeota archaeon]
MTNINLKTTQHAHDSRNGHTLEGFVELLKSRSNVAQLRKYADKLVRDDVPVTSICSSSSDYFGRMVCVQPYRAKRIAQEMSGEPYYWECWLK